MSTTVRPGEALEIEPATSSFTEAQRRHFQIGCESIDKLLREIEVILASGNVASPFRRYLMDISPAQGRVVEDYIRRLRAQLVRALSWQDMEPSPPTVPATRAIKVHLQFVDIALADLRPKEMRGSGALPDSTAAELTGILGELSSVVGEMMTYLTYDLKESLQERVRRIDPAGQNLLLARLEQVITRQGLVEFRPRFDSLLAGLESAVFEVAVFGRVSAGKSSFLNALLQTDLLPVGVHPITAVPTRIQFGDELKAWMRVGAGARTEVAPGHLRSLITEAGNPGNREGLQEALFELPAARLRAGIVLVDTPGLGSLALQGSKETLAYLPACDLALVLVDAGGTLTPEDIGTLRLLSEAGIAALVMLSKADLVMPAERASAIAYVQEQLERELHTPFTVFPVSVVPECLSMVTDVYHQELEVRFTQAHELKQRSISTKLLRLRDDLVAALGARAERFGQAASTDHETVHELEAMLLDTSTLLGKLDRLVSDRVSTLSNISSLMDRSVQALSAVILHAPRSSVEWAVVLDVVQDIVQAEVAELVSMVQQNAQRVLEIIQNVGRALKSHDLPEQSGMLRLLRDAPRLELPPQTGVVHVGAWRVLGEAAVRSRLARALSSEAEPLLRRELTAYGRRIEAWIGPILRDLRSHVDSFGNVYRASLRQSGGVEHSVHEAALMQEDISLLEASL